MTETLDRLRSALADRYTIEREIGSGGMATVYLAEDLKHHRKVAVKVLRPDLAATLGPERFLREIEVAAQLSHPHILPLYDSGRIGGWADGRTDDSGEQPTAQPPDRPTAEYLFYVMPYVEGQSLRDKLAKEGELPIGDAVRILRDVVDALTEAHANGVVHRDIKPENILLRGRHALVTDFGVAKAVSEATGREKLTTAGVALGTPAYMAPEQAAADPHLDHRVDIYAVGAVAYELLTGRPVFMGTTPQQVLSAHVTEAPQPVTKHRDTVPPALEAVVMRCLEKKPADRYQSAEELLPLLESLATPSGGVTPTDTRPLAAATGRRRWLVPGGIAAAAVLIVAGYVGSRLFADKPLTVTTSNIRPVTSDPEQDWHPALSPDGNQVAFVSARDGRESVYVRSTLTMSSDLSLTRDLPESWSYDFPRWSANGEFVRFRTCGESGCSWREVPRLGGPARALGLTDRDVSWSPDDSRVLFRVGDSLFTYSFADTTATLIAVHDTLYFGIHSATWSPDGRRIAYVNGNAQRLTSPNVSNSSIWVVNARGGVPARVTGEESMDMSPAWLDDNHLLFVSNRDGPLEVLLAEIGSEGLRGELRKVPGIVDPSSISYSIAGRKLAFLRSAVRQNIWSYPIRPGTASITDGHAETSERALIELHDASHDGRWIVYDQNLEGSMDIYKRSLETGRPVRITDLPGNEFEPSWSPDGTEIAFQHILDDRNEVMVIGADGGTPRTIASRPLANGMPRWSPSGLEIAFRSRQDLRRWEVWLVSRETLGGPWGEPTQLTDFGTRQHDWAPDGSGVLCETAQELVLVSRQGEVLWRYRPSMAGLRTFARPRYSRDGSTIYIVGTHADGSQGIWAVPVSGGEPTLAVSLDDPDLTVRGFFSVGPSHLFVTVGEVVESDIWVADVEVGG